MASEDALRALLSATAGRGLYFVDSGEAEQSIAREVSAATGAAFARGDRLVDRNPTREAIEKEFAAIEDLAKQRGSAVAVAGAYPVTIDRLTAWAASLEEKGIALVPVSALVEVREPPQPSPTRAQPRRPAPPRSATPAAPVELPSDPQPFETAPHP